MKRFDLGIYTILLLWFFHPRKSSQVKPENQIYTTVLNKVYEFYYSFFVIFSTVYLLYLLKMQNILLTRLYILHLKPCQS